VARARPRRERRLHRRNADRRGVARFGRQAFLGRLEAQPLQHHVQHAVVQVADKRLEVFPDEIPELVIGTRRVAAGTDDGVVVRQAARGSQPVEAGEQFAFCEVARRSEDDEYVWRQRFVVCGRPV
jgi:hypothetical protein